MNLQACLLATTFGLLFLTYFLHRRAAFKLPGATDPPGPPSHPFFGHTFQVPTIKTWKYFEKLFHQYGQFIFRTI